MVGASRTWEWFVSEGCALSAGSTSPSVAALESASLVLRQPAPDAGVLTGLQRPFQAGVDYLAATADRFGLVDLRKGGTRVPDREEQLRVLVQAGSAVAPVHQDRAPRTHRRVLE